MSNISFYKIVHSLPSILEPNAQYYVRSGQGFDLYITDATGSIAHKLNAPSIPGLTNTLDYLLSKSANPNLLQFPKENRDTVSYENARLRYFHQTNKLSIELPQNFSNNNWINYFPSRYLGITNLEINPSGDYTLSFYADKSRLYFYFNRLVFQSDGILKGDEYYHTILIPEAKTNYWNDGSVGIQFKRSDSEGFQIPTFLRELKLEKSSVATPNIKPKVNKDLSDYLLANPNDNLFIRPNTNQEYELPEGYSRYYPSTKYNDVISVYDPIPLQILAVDLSKYSADLLEKVQFGYKDNWYTLSYLTLQESNIELLALANFNLVQNDDIPIIKDNRNYLLKSYSFIGSSSLNVDSLLSFSSDSFILYNLKLEVGKVATPDIKKPESKSNQTSEGLKIPNNILVNGTNLTFKLDIINDSANDKRFFIKPYYDFLPYFDPDTNFLRQINENLKYGYLNDITLVKSNELEMLDCYTYSCILAFPILIYSGILYSNYNGRHFFICDPTNKGDLSQLEYTLSASAAPISSNRNESLFINNTLSEVYSEAKIIIEQYVIKDAYYLGQGNKSITLFIFAPKDITLEQKQKINKAVLFNGDQLVANKRIKQLVQVGNKYSFIQDKFPIEESFYDTIYYLPYPYLTKEKLERKEKVENEVKTKLYISKHSVLLEYYANKPRYAVYFEWGQNYGGGAFTWYMYNFNASSDYNKNHHNAVVSLIKKYPFFYLSSTTNYSGYFRELTYKDDSLMAYVSTDLSSSMKSSRNTIFMTIWDVDLYLETSNEQDIKVTIIIIHYSLDQSEWIKNIQVHSLPDLLELLKNSGNYWQNFTNSNPPEKELSFYIDNSELTNIYNAYKNS